MATVIPILRIFNYDKAIEFYVNWLEFKIDWEDQPSDAPVYLQISYQDIIIHLSEHHGDCCPGGRIYIGEFEELRNYHKKLIGKNYKYNKPGLEKTPWQTTAMEVIDPFGNRLSFNE